MKGREKVKTNECHSKAVLVAPYTVNLNVFNYHRTIDRTQDHNSQDKIQIFNILLLLLITPT
jgi:hypothetical protein